METTTAILAVSLSGSSTVVRIRGGTIWSPVLHMSFGAEIWRRVHHSPQPRNCSSGSIGLVMRSVKYSGRKTDGPERNINERRSQQSMHKTRIPDAFSAPLLQEGTSGPI